jgi:hypothetical protein
MLHCSQLFLKMRKSFKICYPTPWLQQVEHKCTHVQNTSEFWAYVGKHTLLHMTTNSDTHLSSYHHCPSIMACNHSTQSDICSKCKKCQHPSELTWILENIFQANVTEAHYMQAVVKNSSPINPWDHDKIQWKCFSHLKTDIRSYIIAFPYDFMANTFLVKLKQTIKPGAWVVLCITAKNYSYNLEIYALRYQWNNTLVTIHCFAICIKDIFLLHLLIKIYFRLPKTCNIYQPLNEISLTTLQFVL